MMMIRNFALTVSLLAGLMAASGPSMAVDASDSPVLDAILQGEDAGLNTIEYLANDGETVTIYEGVDLAKFEAGLALFVGGTAPGAASYVFGDEDESDGQVLVMAFGPQGEFIGAGWIAKTVIDSVVEYASSGM